MKKKVLTAAIGTLCVLGITTAAIASEVDFHSASWLEWGRTYNPDGTPSNTNPYDLSSTQALNTDGTWKAPDGTEDSFGIIDIDYINYTDFSGYFWNDSATEQIALMYSGGDDVAILNTALTQYLFTDNFTIRFYKDSDPDAFLEPSPPPIFRDTTDRTGALSFNGVTDGTLLLELTGHKRYLDFCDGDATCIAAGGDSQTYELLAQGDLSSGAVAGNMYLDVTPGVGLWADYFDTDQYDLSAVAVPAGYGFADFKLAVTTSEFGSPLNWNLSGVGHAVADVIPEPATMFLLGTGLVGIAGAARRRKKIQA